MPNLPYDIILDILLRLPVKSLLQLKCASKSWCSLISDPYFVKLHLSRSVLDPDAETNHSKLLTASPFRSLDYDSDDFDGDNAVVNLGHPWEEAGNNGVKILGSCHGLVCLLFNPDRIVLWNPTTRQSRELPPPPCSSSGISFCGIGYDSSSDDYKVILAARSSYADETKLQVYSLKASFWRPMEEGLHNLITVLDEAGTFLNGSLHWRASRDMGLHNQDLIISLDLAKEKFSVIRPPDVGNRNISFHTLGVSQGCLSLCSYGYELNVCVWIMKDYGVRGSWTRLITLRSREFDYCDYMVPVCFTKNGDIIVDLDGRKLARYSVEEKSCRYLTNHIDDLSERMVYVESLVSPHYQGAQSP
ncbi:hypothetical protein NMG60_11017652 [Bertholletia excelsa]